MIITLLTNNFIASSKVVLQDKNVFYLNFRKTTKINNVEIGEASVYETFAEMSSVHLESKHSVMLRGQRW